ncbi:MAG TPA: metallophosphoesterase [Thermoanaerobaculia bacterium]|nr:metallophosphoesterase [Thermoanaerobaculia bacterium]
MKSTPRLPRLVFAFLLGASALASAATLVRGPAIGRVDDTTIAVVWWTDTASDTRLECTAPDGSPLTVRRAERVTRHVAAVAGLASGGLYRYQAYSDEAPMGAESVFRAPRETSEAGFRFGVIGDTATGYIPAQIADQFVESGVDLVIHTGDVVYPDGADDLYDQEFFRPMARWLARGPVLPTLGNHDIHTDRGAPLFSNFVLPKNSATGESRFYSLRHANALFVCLDVESSAFGYGSPQYRWLVQTLAGSSATWKFVYFHEPPYSSASPNNVVRLILSPVFESYGVDVVFCGHEHLYERTYPIRDFGFHGPGVVYLTEGGGGSDLDAPRGIQSYSAFVASRHGYLIGEIAGGRLLLTAHDADGSVFDSVALEKAARVPVAGDGAARRPRIVVWP